MVREFSEVERREFLKQQEARGSSANVIIENELGEVLVVKANYKRYWSLPGGWIDHDETPKQAAVREVKEEIGLDISPDDLELEFVTTRKSNLAMTYLFVFRLQKTYTREVDGLDLQSDELDAAQFVSRQTVREADTQTYNLAIYNWAADRPKRYVEQVLG